MISLTNQSSLVSLHPTFIQKTALFACFRFLIFHPFFQGGGQWTPFAPMCGRRCLGLAVLFMYDVMFAHSGPCWRHFDTAAASDVTASSCASYRPCCVVIVASGPRRRRAPRRDDSTVQGVPGAESAVHHCFVEHWERKCAPKIITNNRINLFFKKCNQHFGNFER